MPNDVIRMITNRCYVTVNHLTINTVPLHCTNHPHQYNTLSLTYQIFNINVNQWPLESWYSSSYPVLVFKVLWLSWTPG